MQQLGFDLHFVPLKRKRPNESAPEERKGMQIELYFDHIPRAPKRSTTCAGATEVTLDGVTKPAMVWAAERGLKWQTVKMRRLRGDNWRDALQPGMKHNTYMQRWSLG